MDVHGFSFPSGHTAAAAACWSAVALVLGRDRPRAARALLAGGAALIAIVVATSRALLGVHWVSDVIAGLALGWGWFLLVAVVFGGRTQRLGDPVSDNAHERRPIDGQCACCRASRRMSTANLVPETIDLTADERAIDTIRAAGAKTILVDGFRRFRAADGFSHSRAMAFQLVLALIPGTIVLVAIASELRWESLSNAIIHSVESLAPGPTADVFREAFGQGQDAGSTESGWTALIVAGPALLIAGTTAFGQIERTANRIYGIEADRPSVQKYSLAALMMLSAGTLAVLYFLVVGLGGGWIDDGGQWATAWSIGRWPVGLGLLAGAIAIVFKLSPRRRQPPMPWLAFGAVLAVAGSLIVTVLLTLYLNASEGFGETYGALAGFMGVLLWAYGSSIAMFYGLACAAQLEAFRAGVAAPRDEAKVRESEPDAVVVPYGTAAMHPGGST